MDYKIKLRKEWKKMTSEINNKTTKSTENIKFTKEEYETVKWAMLLADEKISELYRKYSEPNEIEKLKEQQQNIVEIIGKVRNLTK